jgi:50S ribosomal protein L16 3-hydroxylase
MLENESTEHFLSAYWQKKPRFMPAAAETGLPRLSGDELAWLATLPDVESRLVFTEHGGNATSYRLENGPFDESRLAELPRQDWTLLVNDVDKHLPDFRAYLEMIDFLPDWRIDDLMVSFAAPGGGVGPHVDNYDVFLVQEAGDREWRIGYPGRTEPDETSTSLSLVRPFDPRERFRTGPGDVLYLPPGIPHWGIATGFCTTYSIGMRAPTFQELELAAERCIADFSPSKQPADHRFYTDADLAPDEVQAGRIHRRVLDRLRAQSMVDESLSDKDIATILGSAVTDPKAWLAPDPVTGEDADTLIGDSRDLRVHGMARMAWFEGHGDAQVFVNGVGRQLAPGELEVIANLCRKRQLAASEKRTLLRSPGGEGLLRWLFSEGLFDVAGDPE